MDFFGTVLDVVDARSFSNLWYWLVLAGAWSWASHFVLGVPWDMVTRARREGGQAEDDLHDLLRVHVLRRVAVSSTAGAFLLGLVSMVLTALAVLGFGYGVEFAAAAFLLLAPLVLVQALSIRTARDLAIGRAPGETLYTRLTRLRRIVQGLGLVTIFVTAMVGMRANLVAGAF